MYTWDASPLQGCFSQFNLQAAICSAGWREALLEYTTHPKNIIHLMYGPKGNS